MDDEFQDLQRLLRLKRHETPPPAYFEDFMAEFHRRQREELLRRPLWRLALDRLEAAMPNFSPTFAMLTPVPAPWPSIAATLVSTHILTTPDGHLGGCEAAQLRSLTSIHVREINIYSAKSPSLRLAPELNFDAPHRVATSSASNRTRYVLDAPSVQPVVYEQRSDF